MKKVAPIVAFYIFRSFSLTQKIYILYNDIYKKKKKQNLIKKELEFFFFLHSTIQFCQKFETLIEIFDYIIPKMDSYNKNSKRFIKKKNQIAQ